MAESPTNIRVLKDEGVLELTWPSNQVSRYPFYLLRCECPCASCINEFTGERILDPATVPRDIKPADAELSGNYALKFKWNDGHMTGLYSWDMLDRLASHEGVETVNLT